jgi:hypothetical protein
MMEAILSPKRWFFQEPQGVTSLKATFFTVTAVTTSNLATRTAVFMGSYVQEFSKEFKSDLHNLLQ